MSQQEGETNYKYEDYASEMAFHRIAQTEALTGQTFRITLESEVNFVLEFVERNKVIWKSGNEGGTDWCEVVEVAPLTYFIDMTFAGEPRQCQTLHYQHWYATCPRCPHDHAGRRCGQRTTGCSTIRTRSPW